MSVSNLSVEVLATLAGCYRTESAALTLQLPVASTVPPGTRLTIHLEETTALRIEADEEIRPPGPVLDARYRPSRVTVIRTLTGWKILR